MIILRIILTTIKMMTLRVIEVLRTQNKNIYTKIEVPTEKH